jgi:tetratricopeptide (TPR) repeat protein
VGNGGMPVGAARPGAPFVPQPANVPAGRPPTPAGAASLVSAVGNAAQRARVALGLGKNSSANLETFELLLNERDEGLRTHILQQLDLALRTTEVADSILLSDWKVFCARLLAAAGQRGAASASAELKALHSTCTTLYAWSDPNGPGGLMEMALQGWLQLEQSLTENEVEAWGAVQHSLGLAYQDRVVGDVAHKNQRAIWHFNQSLSVYDRARFPTQWAKTHHKLAMSLLALERIASGSTPIGLLDEQRRLGLLAYAVSEANSLLPSSARGLNQPSASSALRAIGDGTREASQNVETAISHLERALQVYIAEQNAENTWRLHLDLASAHLLSCRGDPSAHVDRAIMYFEAALRSPGFSHETQPHQWATMNEALAVATLIRRPESEEQRLGHLDKAIRHYLNVLDVQRLQGATVAWAATQRAIADAWMAMATWPQRAAIAGDSALFHYQEALQVLTRDKHAIDFARTHRFMARATFAAASAAPAAPRSEGAPGENAAAERRELLLQRMLGHYNTSLEVFNKTDHAEEWVSRWVTLLHVPRASRGVTFVRDAGIGAHGGCGSSCCRRVESQNAMESRAGHLPLQEGPRGLQCDASPASARRGQGRAGRRLGRACFW